MRGRQGERLLSGRRRRRWRGRDPQQIGFARACGAVRDQPHQAHRRQRERGAGERQRHRQRSDGRRKAGASHSDNSPCIARKRKGRRGCRGKNRKYDAAPHDRRFSRHDDFRGRRLRDRESFFRAVAWDGDVRRGKVEPRRRGVGCRRHRQGLPVKGRACGSREHDRCAGRRKGDGGIRKRPQFRGQEIGAEEIARRSGRGAGFGRDDKAQCRGGTEQDMSAAERRRPGYRQCGAGERYAGKARC